MAYDDGRLNMSYHLGAVDAGAGLVTRLIAVPTDGPDTTTPGSGRRGRVQGVLLHNIAEDFDATAIGVQVGDGTDVDLYYDTGLAITTDGTADVGDSLWLPDDGSAVDIPSGRTDITVTIADSVTTGIADFEIFITWD